MYLAQWTLKSVSICFYEWNGLAEKEKAQNYKWLVECKRDVSDDLVK